MIQIQGDITELLIKKLRYFVQFDKIGLLFYYRDHQERMAYQDIPDREEKL